MIASRLFATSLTQQIEQLRDGSVGSLAWATRDALHALPTLRAARDKYQRIGHPEAAALSEEIAELERLVAEVRTPRSS